METDLSVPTPAVAAADPPSLDVVMVEDAQVEVLRAAKAARVLGALASSSKQLCRLTRSRVPVGLSITTPEHAEMVIMSQACGRPPFSACTQLRVRVDSLSSCLIAVGVFQAVQHWAALAHVELSVCLSAEQLQPNQTLDYCSASILGVLPALGSLRCLELYSPAFGACSARQLGQLVQLTKLKLSFGAPATASAVPADLAALSGMTSLLELELSSAPAVKPAGSMGPFCFPSSLTYLEIREAADADAGAIARCVTHLPGCPHLQELEVHYFEQHHPSAHPSAVVGLLAQHNRQLRRVFFAFVLDDITWDAHVPGLPAPEGLRVGEWRPNASLAALTGLQCLDIGLQLLCVTHQEDWQHLAQLTALSFLGDLQVTCVPPPLSGLALIVLDLGSCNVQLGGHDLGRLLLACPRLQRAHMSCQSGVPAAAAPHTVQCLEPHPSLQSFQLYCCSQWGTAAAVHLAALAPVLQGVTRMGICGWPNRSSSQPRASLPDMLPFTALTDLQFGTCGEGSLPEQEDFLVMLAPLVQLRYLEVQGAPRLNERVALVLQHMLPRLRMLRLWGCGSQLPLAADAADQQRN